jgi:hypothetical protein
MKSIAITLQAEEMLEMKRVLLDGDAAGALEFLEKHIAPKLPGKGTAPCDSTRLNPYLRRK